MDHVPELALDRDALNPPLDTAAKRALIEAELRKDAGRSDREIARVVGCDHKTVGSARERLGIAIPLAGNISPSISPPACPPPPGVIDPPKFDPFDPKEGVMIVPHQPAIAIYENTQGAIVICQCASAYDEEDPIILVRPENLDALIVALRKLLP
jgi:hypothetical protein